MQSQRRGSPVPREQTAWTGAGGPGRRVAPRPARVGVPGTRSFTRANALPTAPTPGPAPKVLRKTLEGTRLGAGRERTVQSQRFHTRTPTSRPTHLRSPLKSLSRAGLPCPLVGPAACTGFPAVAKVAAVPRAGTHSVPWLRWHSRRTTWLLARSPSEAVWPQSRQQREQSKLRRWAAGPGASFPDCGLRSPGAAGGAGCYLYGPRCRRPGALSGSDSAPGGRAAPPAPRLAPARRRRRPGSRAPRSPLSPAQPPAPGGCRPALPGDPSGALSFPPLAPPRC